MPLTSIQIVCVRYLIIQIKQLEIYRCFTNNDISHIWMKVLLTMAGYNFKWNSQFQFSVLNFKYM